MRTIKVEEATQYCNVTGDTILRFIEEEWIIPENNLFDDEDLARIRLIDELITGFGVNEEAVPIILNLLDQINFMHLELKKMNREETMYFRKWKPSLGETLRISDMMSLRFEKVADDLEPIWHEIPAVDGSNKMEEGHYVEVTPDCWFVFDHERWRMMTPEEHSEASRQNYLSP